jgi:hypothetical protein
MPRTIRPVAPTAVAAVDVLLEGGLPIGAISEFVGPASSGRTSLSLSFLARATGVGSVGAWIDVSDELDPESAAAAGVDLSRLLWVRCGVSETGLAQSDFGLKSAAAKQAAETLALGAALKGHGLIRAAKSPITNGALAPEGWFPPAQWNSRPFSADSTAKKGLHGGGFGPHPRTEVKGMPAAVGELLRLEAIAPRCAEPQPRPKPEREAVAPVSPQPAPKGYTRARAARPWARIEQALRVTDLLLQAGGFAAIVLDMGSIAPEYATRVPMATWFRYRAAAERAQASLLLLTQHPCAKSSGELLLRFEAGRARVDEATVFTGIEHRVEVDRRRFTQTPANVVSIRKPPQRETAANWRSRSAWAGER